MPEPEPQSKVRTPRDPQALSSEYHKARKQLMLWAGILFIWELVGIDLEKARQAGGNAGAIITAIKSPQAVPWVLLILVAYFLFKTAIEWYQCNESRRRLKVSRIDFLSAVAVTVLAYALYAYQAIKRVQLADALTYYSVYSFFSGALIGWAIGSGGFYLVLSLIARRRGKRFIAQTLKWITVKLLLAISLAALTYPIARLLGLPVRFLIVLVTCVLIAIVSAGMSFMNWILLRSTDPPSTNAW